MYRYMKFLILIIFSLLLCIEDIKYKKVSIRTFSIFYLITFIICLTETYINYQDYRSLDILSNALKSIALPLIICSLLFIICYRKKIPLGEGDILFIFILFFYFTKKEVFSILITSLFITFIASIIIISINMIINKKITNKAIPFIPAFLPGIIYFIGEKLWRPLKLHLLWWWYLHLLQ